MGDARGSRRAQTEARDGTSEAREGEAGDRDRRRARGGAHGVERAERAGRGGTGSAGSGTSGQVRAVPIRAAALFAPEAVLLPPGQRVRRRDILRRGRRRVDVDDEHGDYGLIEKTKLVIEHGRREQTGEPGDHAADGELIQPERRPRRVRDDDGGAAGRHADVALRHILLDISLLYRFHDTPARHVLDVR